VGRIRLGEATVDLATGRVQSADVAFVLPDRERDLLVLLASAAGNVVPRARLGGDGGSRAADMAVSRLRKSLGDLGRRVATVRGVGYRLEVDDDAETTSRDLGWGRFEPELRCIRLQDRTVELTEQQAALVAVLAQSPGKPVPRLELARSLWGASEHASRLDLLLHRLRTRLEDDATQPRYLVSLRGRGIVLLDSRLAGVRRGAPTSVGPDLIGRDDDVAAASALLGSPGRRVVVHGPPGIGKSAVARAVAASWSDEHRRGTHLAVDLHGVQDAREAEGRLVAALGMEDLERDDVVQRALGAHGDLLLSLDGALPAPLAARLERWLGVVGSLHVLVAAREAATGWPVVELPGLAEAHALTLLERVSGHPLDAGAARICRRVDGNPLALELLGKGLRTATTDALYRRLEVPLTPLLRAWKAALEDLAEADHRSVVALSPFRRPFDAADVGPVVGIAGDEVAALVEQLVGRSMLQRTVEGQLAVPSAAREILRGELRRDPAGGELRARYVSRCRLVLERIVDELETRGGPALDELEQRWPDLDGSLDVGPAGPSADPRLLARLARRAERAPRPRRAAWSESLQEASARTDLSAADRAACLRGVHALDWASMARAERTDLLRTALGWAAEDGDRVLAGAIAAELASIVAFSFGAAEAHQLLRAFPLPAHAPPEEQIRRLRHVGRLGLFEGRPQVGVPRLADAVARAEAEGLPLLEARCRMWLGHAISVATQSAEAEHHLRRAVALTAEHGLPEQHLRATLRLSQHLLRLGLRAESVHLLDAGFDAAIKGGLVSLEEQVAGTLGYLHILEGRFDAAVHALDRTVELSREHGAQRALWVALSNRGLAHGLAGRMAVAETDLNEALAMDAVAGWYRALAVAHLAVARVIGGAGVATAEEAIADCEGLEHPEAPKLADALRMLAAVGSQRASADDARVWLDGFDGGAEVEAVVLGIRRAAGGLAASSATRR